MSLPMLVNAAECGASNPLQGLSKRFDQDRGLQQDHFGAGRAGSSKETFRTQATGTHDQDAARFFSSPAQQLSMPAPFDLSAIQGTLPQIQFNPNQQHQQPTNAPLAAWATDFMHQQPKQAPVARTPGILSTYQTEQENARAMVQQQTAGSGPLHMISPLPAFRMNSVPTFAPAMSSVMGKPTSQIDQSRWDEEFQSQETSIVTATPLQEIQHNQQTRQSSRDDDELARTAGLLVETVKNEQNPKFQNSEFLGLMKQLRDRMVVVDGNAMVEASSASTTTTSNGANDFRVDRKGKGRAFEPPSAGPSYRTTPMNRSQVAPSSSGFEQVAQIDDNDAYFQEENAAYMKYWNEHHQPPPSQQGRQEPWDVLQEQWERYEASTLGVKTVPSYHFQANNPYVVGDTTRHHSMHIHNSRRSLHESVLELEAAVQRNPSDDRAWFELGVKQQENERESQAIQALQRAVELNPAHLPTWLALAISHTNENNRSGAYESVKAWVERNSKYRGAVLQHRAQFPESATPGSVERFNSLIQTLIAMARSDSSGNIDADIQIALAVLLNTNEDYGKAQDCFRTALEVRPDDWQLYNRVGATMANSGQPADALQYYHRALELNPTYIRARFNLGISCINLGRYDEAAQYILDALVLQDSDGVLDMSEFGDQKQGVTSSALWDSLKTSCLHMQRVDLATLCDRRDLDGFRQAFQPQGLW